MQYAIDAIRDRSAATMAIIFGEDFLPFPGLYSTRGLPSLLTTWSDGHRSVRAWHERLAGEIIRIPVSTRDQAKTFNTPEELAAILRDMPRE
jgi:molybdopterin-guanine dinucleotide biosynthesis protein A